RTDPQPNRRRTDKEVVVTGTQDAGNQRQGNDNVQPLLDHLTVNTGDLDQDIGQDGSHDQFPDTFNPQVNHIPPVVLVTGQVFGVVEGEQEQQCQTDQTGHHHHVDGGVAALEDGHADVIQECQRHNHNANLGG